MFLNWDAIFLGPHPTRLALLFLGGTCVIQFKCVVRNIVIVNVLE